MESLRNVRAQAHHTRWIARPWGNVCEDEGVESPNPRKQLIVLQVRINRVNNFVRVFVLIMNRVLPAWLIWFARWNLFGLQEYKSSNSSFFNKTTCILSFVLICNKIESVVLNRACIKGLFVLNWVGFKPSAVHLYPNSGRVPPPSPLPP